LSRGDSGNHFPCNSLDLSINATFTFTVQWKVEALSIDIKIDPIGDRNLIRAACLHSEHECPICRKLDDIGEDQEPALVRSLLGIKSRTKPIRVEPGDDAFDPESRS